MIKSYSAGPQPDARAQPELGREDRPRPAYPDKIVWKAGGDPKVLARQTLAARTC